MATSMLIGRDLSAASRRSSAALRFFFVDFDFFLRVFISWINMEIHKKMRKAKFAVNKVRVLLEEVTFERAMYSLPTIRQRQTP